MTDLTTAGYVEDAGAAPPAELPERERERYSRRTGPGGVAVPAGVPQESGPSADPVLSGTTLSVTHARIACRSSSVSGICSFAHSV